MITTELTRWSVIRHTAGATVVALTIAYGAGEAAYAIEPPTGDAAIVAEVAALVEAATPAGSAPDESLMAAVQAVSPSEAPVTAAVSPTAETALTAVDPTTLAAVSVPVDAADGVSAGSAQNAVLIDLPVDETEVQPAKVDPVTKAVVYEQAGVAVDLVVQPTAESGVRIMAVLHGPEAASEFSYPLTVPAGTTLVATPDGGAEVRDADGLAVSTIELAWATDADGLPVPTRYVVEGTTLTQVVDHAGTTAYPVVADPTVTRNCGWATCSFYISVLKTRQIATSLGSFGSQVALVTSGAHACFVIGLSLTGPAAAIVSPVCTLIYGIGAVYVSQTFGNAARSSNCVKLTAGAGPFRLSHVDYSNRYCNWV